jgi:Xylanase inhibitor N-terminal
MERRMISQLFWLIISRPFLADGFPRMELHPYGQFELERRLLVHSELNSSSFPTNWFATNHVINAIYATISKEDDEEQTVITRDFHRYRHISRWERQLRMQNKKKIDLESNVTTNHFNITRKAQESKLRKGNRYQQYAYAPLSHGYGTHYAHIWVGSPIPQRKSVIVDTGSHFTAFPCKGCENCGAQHHTDPYFDPDLSQTFRYRQCHQCELGATCKDDKCYFSQKYTEGSSWEAYQADDLVYLGGRDMLAKEDPRNTNYAIDFMFGCQISENGLFVTQLADGIMGMSAHQHTLTRQMFDKKKVDHNMFAMCFRRDIGRNKGGLAAGFMTLGGVDNRPDISPMGFAKNMAKSGWFTVYVQNIYIRAGGGQRATCKLEPGQHILKIPLDLSVVNGGKGVIVDSGTTDTYLHKKLAKSFAAVWKTVTKKEYNHKGFLLTADQVRRLPTILIQMRAYGGGRSIGAPTDTVGFAGTLDPSAPYDILLAVPATSYLEYSPKTGLYTSRLYFTESAGGVIGANAMQGHNVVFDWESGRVGFAESTCEYDDDHSLKKIRGIDSRSQFGMDCVLGEYVLSRTCVQSIDIKSCGNSIGQIVQGTETWIRSVENYGSKTGMSCNDVALIETPHEGLSPPQIICESGICTEYRPCHVLCSDIKKKEKNLESEKEKQLCPSYWSACDMSCDQTIITSTKQSDGKCYEISRNSRECHIGNCGQDDPCLIPYLVHSVMGFRDARKESWNSETSELFIRALLRCILRRREMKATAQISEGDVNIMMVAPWYEESQSDDIPSKEMGIKIVLQISFHNTKSESDVNDMNKNILGTEDLNLAEIPDQGQKELISSGVEKEVRKSSCSESDLSPLASAAFNVQKIFEDDKFMLELLEEVKHLREGENELLKSSVNSLPDQEDSVKQSKTIAVWTIRTNIEDNSEDLDGSFGVSALSRKLPFHGRTAWVLLTAMFFLIVYCIDRCVNPDESNEVTKSQKSGDSIHQSTSNKISSNVSLISCDDSESAFLLGQLFPGRGRDNNNGFKVDPVKPCKAKNDRSRGSERSRDSHEYNKDLEETYRHNSDRSLASRVTGASSVMDHSMIAQAPIYSSDRKSRSSKRRIQRKKN